MRFRGIARPGGGRVPGMAIGLAVALGVVLLLTGCSRERTDGLLVSAASDVAPAFQEMGQRFEQESGIPVSFNFGSTGQLSQQIQAGAPADVFAAANISYVEDLERRGLIIPDTVALYGRGRLVLWTRAGSPLRLEGITDLAGAGVNRVALANPDHAPYGIAARQALQVAGLWETLQPRLVLGENVLQALQYAETGNVDVALVALSLAIQRGGRYVLVPQELHNPLDQALAVVKGAGHEAEARRFAAYVNSPPGRAIMSKYGFTLTRKE